MKKILAIIFLLSIAACSGGPKKPMLERNMSGAAPFTAFTITDPDKLIGGPLATGRVGDVLLQNDKIRLVIEQPGKTPWVGNFGGGIVDADIQRGSGAGQDNFGFMHPLINIEWTTNVFDYEVINDGTDGGSKLFRTYGMIDVYDYLDIDFISPVAKSMTGQALYFAPRFDDVNDPFNMTELSGLNRVIVTDYTLDPGKNYVKIDTTFENLGGEEIAVPVGDYVNGGGEVMFLVPGLGFTPDMMPQIEKDTPALIYVGFESADVSYGYFYDFSQFISVDEESGEEQRLKTTSLSYSGVTGIILGEEFLKVLPLGNATEPKINFTIPPGASRTMTRYLVVGNGNAGSVFDAGLEVLGIDTRDVAGKVAGSEGDAIAGATVAVLNEAGSTIITYKTDGNGKFRGKLPTGQGQFGDAFGSGIYKFLVYKQGYKKPSVSDSGICGPDEIDLKRAPALDVNCTLGPSGMVKLNGGVFEEGTGKKIPARLTIVGYQPAYKSESGGYFEDKIIFDRPLGVVDVHYVNAQGTMDVGGTGYFRLAPGDYELAFSRGFEYSMEKIKVSITGNAVTSVGPVYLKKIIDTSGYISADFHLHSIVSPDSAMHPLRRVLAAAGEGMDVIQSSDHDYLMDYAPYVKELTDRGYISAGSMISVVGDEVSPNNIGHLNVFPLEHDHTKPCGGALDWGYMPSDIVGPEPDFVMSPQEIVDHIRSLPGEHIIQINHIADKATSLFTMGGWVTTLAYKDKFDVQPMSSYAEPVMLRMSQKVDSSHFPYKFGESGVVITDVDTLELVIGEWLHNDYFLSSSLPIWFNLLNLGYVYTATGDSDSHREIAVPLGIPRNFIASKSDPADGKGSFSELKMDDYVDAIRKHKVIVSAGPIVKIFAKNEEGTIAAVGDTISGSKVKITVDVTSPDWAWFDTIEIYTNTEPVPADDETGEPMEGTAKDPETFHEPYHLQKYYYQPQYSFRLKDGTLKEWKNEDGVIKAKVEIELDLDRDAWVVALVKGTKDTEGFKSLFPFATKALVDADNPSVGAEDIDMGNIDMLTTTGAPAWGFTNPVFIDVDGNGFEGIYSNDLGFDLTKALSGGATQKGSAVDINSSLLR